jgi:hypothetical protein
MQSAAAQPLQAVQHPLLLAAQQATHLRAGQQQMMMMTCTAKRAAALDSTLVQGLAL